MNKIDILKVLYKNLEMQLKLNKKISNGSVLLAFIQQKSNSRFNNLDSSSQKFNRDLDPLIDELLKDGYIRDIHNDLSYAITAQGIWLIENEEILSFEDLVEFIDDKYFDISMSDKKLSDKEKVVIFSFICARAFSADYCIDLKKGDMVLNNVKSIIEKCYTLLADLNLIKSMDSNVLFGKGGNEHIVSHLIRHTDTIPKKTKSIFVARGEQKYYLNLCESGNVSQDRIIYLFKLIFENRMDLTQIERERISDLCLSISENEGIVIYDNIGSSFIVPKYNDLISDAITDAILD